MPEKAPQSEKDFPDWNNLYSGQNVEAMPWYNENLDSDLQGELGRKKISKGKILGLVTGQQLKHYSLQKGLPRALFVVMNKR